ncbi:MAG: diadenylate cyclase [Patescibacteria group bacterium]
MSFGESVAALSMVIAPELRDFFDIFLVSAIIYAFLILLKRTNSYFILGGLATLIIVYIIARLFDFSLTVYLFKFSFPFLVVILVVIFQKELRRFFEWLSTFGFSSQRIASGGEHLIADISKAVEFMITNRIGGIIAIAGHQPVRRHIEGGFNLDGEISPAILKSIFDPSSPGHDGAVVIENGRIYKFGVHLPLADRFDKNLGTRHRAAIGLAERVDAFIIIVSEERGSVSFAQYGQLNKLAGITEFKDALRKFFGAHINKEKAGTWHYWILENFREKVIALLIALLLWVSFIGR